MNAKRAGFTLIELLIAMLIGAVVLSSAMAFTISTFQNVEGNRTREQLDRNARFVGMSLERDMQEAGVMIQSTSTFGTVASWQDTLVILHVPYLPQPAQAYKYQATCGGQCVTVDTGSAMANFEIQAGDVVRLQRTSEPRLLLVSDVSPGAGNFNITFSNAPTILRMNSGITGLVLDPVYYVQKLQPVIYYMDSTRLMRAEQLNPDGTPDGEVLIDNVQSFQVMLLFADGSTAAEASGTDAITTNDFNQVVGVRVTATLAADRVDRSVNGGTLLTRQYDWQFSPRNLMYNRNNN
ncbi:MAG TPA: prepilin-type N-terminal cleavage/methylation domain-containing protein [Gemmatimonadaceae bacterium]|nr:prepilin-type N-terminal cleavage/methylation domain-containing protein [Gemmatimonadaceae bacterium]